MMICAYDKLYLEHARANMARMLDFAVYQLNYTLEQFFEFFIESGLAGRFERGDASVLVGRSGIELAYDVIEKTRGEVRLVEFQPTYNRSPEYWLGWALAYYQWETNLTFSDIIKAVPLGDMIKLYDVYHEMDIRHFVDKMNELYRSINKDTKLKQFRLKSGLSQSELARMTDIPVRTIQQYEQRQKNINKASAEYLIRLSKALYCRVEDLAEISVD